MIVRARSWFVERRVWVWLIVAVVMLGAAAAGRGLPRIVVLLIPAAIGGVTMMQHPRLGLFAIIISALLMRYDISTGTEVVLNIATVLVPVSVAVWFLDMLRSEKFRVAPSRTNLPLALFLVAGLLSLLIGLALWSPAVPRSGRFLIVQLAQWAIFAFAAAAFWLNANLMDDQTWLRRLTYVYLIIAGGLAVLRVVPGGAGLTFRVATFAVDRAPFWLLLTAVGGGQLLFNKHLPSQWRWFLTASLVSVVVYAFVYQRATASNWVGVAAVLGVLVWLRWPQLRWPLVVLLALLIITGLLSSFIYDFAGGDDEWVESGGSRLLLISRVIDVTMRNPITGLGPAAYRPYTAAEPLMYYRAYWVAPQINSHNNWVDLFSHVGLLGLAIFIWFAVEITLLGFRLRGRYTEGFAAGYVNAMLAAWAGALVLMLLADWILPFVYNIGFPGFQASVLIWMFLGGLVALENAKA